MNDTITIRGIVATEPRHLVTEGRLDITSIRLASPSRRWDRATSSWVNGETNWYTVTAFRSLAINLKKSVNKGDRIIVCGRLKVRQWERADRSGVAVEIDADTVGHDLAWGQATWMKVPRTAAEDQAAPGETPAADNTGPGTTPEALASDPAVAAGEPPSDAADPERDHVDGGGGPVRSGVAIGSEWASAGPEADMTDTPTAPF